MGWSSKYEIFLKQMGHQRIDHEALAKKVDERTIDSKYILLMVYLEPKWPLFWLKRSLFWRVDLQKQKSFGL